MWKRKRSPFDKDFLGKTGSLTQKIEVWERELDGDIDSVFLLNGIQHGFKLSDLCLDTYDNVVQVELNNHPSASEHAHLVEKELLKQIKLGY